MKIPRRPSRFLFYFIFCLFVYFFFIFFFSRMINLSGERNWKTIFFFLNSQFMTLFFNDFHWKCMNINGSKKFPLLTHANRILFFLVLQFIKGICSFFFYFLFSLFHSMDQHVQNFSGISSY